MKINEITTPNYTNKAQQQSFSGRVITKGPWTESLKNAFLNSKAINELASGEKDVIGRLKFRPASMDDYNHVYGEPVFKLSLEMKSQKPSLKERIKSVLGLSRKVINRYYHSEKSLAEKIQDMSQGFCIHRMKQNLR